MLRLIWFIVGCSSNPDIDVVSSRAAVMQAVDLHPEQAATLCQDIVAAGQREFCLLYALAQLPKERLKPIRQICQVLKGNAQAECWLQVAEQTGSPEDCISAAPFEKECRIQLSLQDLQVNPAKNWSELMVRATQFGLDRSNEETITLLAHLFFGDNQPLNLQKCPEMSETDFCHRFVMSQYAQRVTEWDLDTASSCDAVPEKIQHGEQPVLKNIFEDVYNRKCR